MLILFSHHLVNTGFYTINVSEQLLFVKLNGPTFVLAKSKVVETKLFYL